MKRHSAPIFLVALVLWVGCGEDAALAPLALTSPAVGSSSGYYEVEVRVGEAGVIAEAVEGVHFGANRAFDLRIVDETTVAATVQGEATPGAVDVVLEVGGEAVRLEAAFEYEPPRDPRFGVVVALGASLTQGVQAGTPSFGGALMSPSAQIARQMGAYHPLPLLVPGLFAPITPGDVGPPPQCAIPDIVEFSASTSVDVVARLTSPDGSEFGFQFARIDPDIEIHNVAVGGSRLADVLHGPPSGNIGVTFVSHMVYEPYGPIGAPVEQTQTDLIEGLSPTLIISTDLFGNDLAAGFLGGSTIDVENITPIEDFEADLRLLLGRLAATGAEAFLANMPRPGLLPAALEKRQLMIDGAREAGEDPDAAEAEADARIAQINALARDFNALLDEVAAEHPTIHVVDMAARVEVIAAEGIEITEGVRLTTQKFGGLLGIDGVHFTDTGYAMVANLFIETINATLGTEVPEVDISAVFAGDTGAPAELEAGGIDLSACLR